MRNRFLLSIGAAALLALGTQQAYAQGMAVNTTGATANSSALLDVSSTTQGVLVPRMTSAQRTAISVGAAQTGLLVYQTDGTAGFYYYTGSGWLSLNSTSTTVGGDLTGTYPNPTIANTSGAGNDIVTALGSATTKIPASAMPAHSGDVTSTAGSVALSIANNATAGNNIVTALGSATSGTIPAARLGTSSGSATTFLNGTGAFSTPSGGSGGYIWSYVNNLFGQSTTYASLNGTSISSSTSPYPLNSTNSGATIMPVSCTFDAIYISGVCRLAGSGATNFTITISKNGTNSSITANVTIPNGATVGQAFTTGSGTGTFAVSAGDIVYLTITNDNPAVGPLAVVQVSTHAH